MNILVTGATGGIGGAICKELKSVGNVYATGRGMERLKRLDVSEYCACDIAEDTEPLIAFIKQNDIDVLINNAGEYICHNIEDIRYTDMDRLFKVNLISPVTLISAAIPNMKNNNWGRIINIGSISGVMGEAYASVYSSSKSGLIGLTKSLALELAQNNITVNVINPGWVDTKLGRESVEDSEFSEEEILSIVPQKRYVTPEEVAKLVRYLISDDARGITGQSINLCAGMTVGF